MANACPVNFKHVDENQIRVQAIFVALSAILFIVTGSIFVALFLVYDFAVRIFATSKLSPIAQIASLILKTFKISFSPVDSAPKIFASKIGLIFAIAISIVVFFDFNQFAMILAVILLICAGLEALFNFCVGCKFYSILHYFKLV